MVNSLINLAKASFYTKGYLIERIPLTILVCTSYICMIVSLCCLGIAIASHGSTNFYNTILHLKKHYRNNNETSRWLLKISALRTLFWAACFGVYLVTHTYISILFEDASKTSFDFEFEYVLIHAHTTTFADVLERIPEYIGFFSVISTFGGVLMFFNLMMEDEKLE